MQGFAIVFTAIAYVSLLFAIASIGDRRAATRGAGRPRPYIYALSLAIYCTSWTFFGSVGLASERGPEFLAIYIGPVLVFLFGFPLIRRIIRLAKAEKITSIADFLGARYGKSFHVALIATLIATVGAVPYIALQLKAISGSVNLMVEHYSGAPLSFDPFVSDISLMVAMLLAAVRDAVRNAPCRRHRAPGRAGAGGGGGVGRQAGGVPGGRRHGTFSCCSAARPASSKRSPPARRCSRRCNTAPRSAPGWC